MPTPSSIRPVVSIRYWVVTDGRTDRRTRDDSIYRASIASRDKNLSLRPTVGPEILLTQDLK